ncbi:MAG: hypothetical protein KC996_08015 [Phycisphaerales bacterium]|nr:hypothetical protein [Phycisphaerales bacterium]
MATHHQNKDLPDYIQHALARSVGASGGRIVERAVHDLESDVSLRYADRHTPFHSLAYRPDLEQHREHLLLESATKIRRMIEAPIESRLVPEPTGSLPFHISMNQASQTVGALPPIPIDQQRHVLFESIARIPTDLRVYRDILDAHPGHTDALWAYAQEHGPCPVFIGAYSDTLIPELIEPMASMYAAYAIEMNALLGESGYPIPEPHAEIGRTLADRLYACVPQGHQGDVVATESWAYTLGLEAVYRWNPVR